MVELSQSFGDDSGGSSLSVLRTFRVLRLIKLVRFMPTLRRQLAVMLRTIDNVAVFFVLFCLFVFIFRYRIGLNLNKTMVKIFFFLCTAFWECIYLVANFVCEKINLALVAVQKLCKKIRLAIVVEKISTLCYGLLSQFSRQEKR